MPAQPAMTDPHGLVAAVAAVLPRAIHWNDWQRLWSSFLSRRRLGPVPCDHALYVTAIPALATRAEMTTWLQGLLHDPAADPSTPAPRLTLNALYFRFLRFFPRLSWRCGCASASQSFDRVVRLFAPGRADGVDARSAR